jgi:uncharacterized membrane protein YqaE (UPF0057 family)
MKKFARIFFLPVLVCISVSASANYTLAINGKSLLPTETLSKPSDGEPTESAFTPASLKIGVDAFLALTPSKYKELTGKKLGLKKSIQLKAAQKMLKKKMGKSADIPKGLYIVGVILGFGWLLMGLMDDFTGKNWWVNLILTMLCWLPGVIHGIIKMKDYYNK